MKGDHVQSSTLIGYFSKNFDLLPWSQFLVILSVELFLAKWLFRSDLWLACSHKAFLTVFTKNLSIFSKFFPKFLCFLEEKFLYIEKLKVKFQPLKRKKIFFWQKRLQSNKFGLMNCILISNTIISVLEHAAKGFLEPNISKFLNTCFILAKFWQVNFMDCI